MTSPTPATRSVLRVLVVLATAVASWGLGAPLVARADTTSVADTTDSTGSVDIESVTSDHTRNGRFRYRVETDRRFLRRDAPCLRIRTPRPNRATYLICGDGAVVDERDGATGARAVVDRPRPRSIVYTVSRSAIGDPSSHRWQVRALDPDCDRGVCDAVPDARWITHRIHVTYEEWGRHFLEEIDARACHDNRVVVLAWQANENTAAVFNPLATTHDMPGSWNFNSVGVQNFVSLGQGLNGTRETLENPDHGYGRIVRALQRCAKRKRTADAIRDSDWCRGCSGGRYVVAIVPHVEEDYRSYADREISTAP